MNASKKRYEAFWVCNRKGRGANWIRKSVPVYAKTKIEAEKVFTTRDPRGCHWAIVPKRWEVKNESESVAS